MSPTNNRETAGLSAIKSLQTSMPSSINIALLSTYPPTQCGLATFTAALFEQLSLSPGRVDVIRVLDRIDDRPQPKEVIAQLINGSPTSAASVVQKLDTYDAVIVQHEYGIYGKRDGIDVIDIIEGVSVPTIVVLHTVLLAPTRRQRRILERIIDAAGIIVTMAETARVRLETQYGVDPSRILVIPHGAIDHRSHRVTRSSGLRPLILTWGLLGPGKGIEWAIDAMVDLRDLMPLYLIIGKTHPKVLERKGEEYRHSLITRANALGVGDLVEFDSNYIELSDLANLVESADLILLPYDSPDQVTSGVLIEAVAAGRPVVSTAFAHAVELLSGGSGLIVNQRDPNAISLAVRRVLSEPGLAEAMANKAANQAPSLVWGAVAERYRSLVMTLVIEGLVVAS